MAAFMLFRHKVKDFKSWKAGRRSLPRLRSYARRCKNSEWSIRRTFTFSTRRN
jgi:hypothetical protein